MTESSYERLAGRLVTRPGVTAGKMFGMPTLKIGSKAFAGSVDEDMVFKLSGKAHAQALGIPGAHLFDPMGGRPMKEWVVVPARQSVHWAKLADAAMEYCSAG
jgi:hypothetical protein